MATQNIAQSIIDAFTEHVLKKGKVPKSVFAFCRKNHWKEEEFYAHFSSFSALESEVFYQMYAQTDGLLKKDKAFEGFDAQNKLLTFYYTFFEVLTANRSLVRILLVDHKSKMEAAKVLSKVRTHFKVMVSELEIETMEMPHEMLEKLKDKGIEEAAWGQLLLTMKFWLDDTSANFEKTDIYIEKAVQAGFDIIKTPPLQSVIDLGKFLFKEKMQNKA